MPTRPVVCFVTTRAARVNLNTPWKYQRERQRNARKISYATRWHEYNRRFGLVVSSDNIRVGATCIDAIVHTTVTTVVNSE